MDKRDQAASQCRIDCCQQERPAVAVCGCVGDGAEFTTFLETQALPDPEDVPAAPQTLRLPRRGDLAVVIVRSILARVKAQNSVKRRERCCAVFEQTYRQNREVAMAGYGRLRKLKPAAYAPPKRNGVFDGSAAKWLAEVDGRYVRPMPPQTSNDRTRLRVESQGL